VQAPFDPQTLNRYTYCRNNPLIYTDPTGHFFGFIIAIIVNAIIGAAIGAAVGAGMAAITGGDIGQGALWGAIGGALMGGISTALGAMATVGAGASFSSTMGAFGTLSVPIQASIMAVSAFSTSLIVGSLQGISGSALWQSAGISAGVAFASTMVIGSISEAMKNQRISAAKKNQDSINGLLSQAENDFSQGNMEGYLKASKELQKLGVDIPVGRVPNSLEKVTLESAFPSLKNALITGERTTDYNCISWTLGITDKWVNPTPTIAGMDQLYGSYGYHVVPKSQAQIALFTKNGIPTHGAVRVTGGIYESKCGALQRILHNLEDLEGSSYGQAVKYYAK